MNTQLWQAVEQFDLEQPLNIYGFSTRLANENGWSQTFTQRAIQEYKKFMYLAVLAARQGLMVSPSAIVDIVWHQHLLFTQSYSAFCQLLGKRIEHIPSTHSRSNANAFRLAGIRTADLYQETFGHQPAEIWGDADEDGLTFRKSKISHQQLGLLILVGLSLCFGVVYWSLKPVMPAINNPYFLISYILVIGVGFLVARIYNRLSLQTWLEILPTTTLLRALTPEELTYLATDRLDGVIKDHVSRLLEQNKLEINEKATLTIVEGAQPQNVYEYTLLDTLQASGPVSFSTFTQQVMSKPIFLNIIQAMNQLKARFKESGVYKKLLIGNAILLGCLFQIGLVRLIVGLQRDKPVGYLIVTLFVFGCILIVHLVGLRARLLGRVISHFYKQVIIPSTRADQYQQWKYVREGDSGLNPYFLLVTTPSSSNQHSDTGGGCQGGDGGGGDGCGGGGDGCGGCGGD